MKNFQILILLTILSACSGLRSLAPDSEQMTMSTLWYQNSAEMTAIYYQSFNIAEHRVQEALKNPNRKKPPAVVVDIDETILDNSPSEARNILEGERYSQDRWYDWTSRASANPLPGSLDFALSLKEVDVELFYISNRNVEELEVTLENLRKHGFPNADKEHVFLKSTTSDKQARREKVMQEHDIVLLVGDNLEDFSEVFADRSHQLGKDKVDKYRDEFGKRFIILPNPMYGSWTSALFGSTSGLSPKEIARLRKKFLADY